MNPLKEKIFIKNIQNVIIMYKDNQDKTIIVTILLLSHKRKKWSH